MPALKFHRVTKSFPHHAGRMLLRDRVREWIAGAPATRFQALQDVSFELSGGETLGIIGANGAGKSTLLNLATGLAQPDSGRIEVHGRVGALLELGAGFHPDLTGAENLLINAALNGLSRRETAARFEDIVAFSGVRDFLHEPLRTYSAGMSMRLAFSIVVHTEPDILLIDEIISVGDREFSAKCLDKIREFQRQGKTILLASHALELIASMCQRAIWLDHGRVMEAGPAASVAAAYQSGHLNALSTAF